MKTFLTTRTTVETFEVQADNAEMARHVAGYGSSNTPTITESVEEKLAQSEYRVVMVEDEHYEIDEQDSSEHVDAMKRALRDYGAYGYIIERRDVVNGTWEHIDDCWGFLGNDLSHMLQQAAESIPFGICAPVIGNLHYA